MHCEKEKKKIIPEIPDSSETPGHHPLLSLSVQTTPYTLATHGLDTDTDTDKRHRHKTDPNGEDYVLPFHLQVVVLQVVVAGANRQGLSYYHDAITPTPYSITPYFAYRIHTRSVSSLQ